MICCCLLSKSCLTLCISVDCTTPRLPCPSPSPRVCSDSCPLSQWLPCNHLILCCPLLLLPSIFPSIRVFSNESALCIRGPRIGASASAPVLSMNIKDWFSFFFFNEKSIFIRNKKENHMTVNIFKINTIGTKYKHFIHCYRNYARGLIWIIAFKLIVCLLQY